MRPQTWRDLLTPGVLASALGFLVMLVIVVMAIVRLTRPPVAPLSYTEDAYQAERFVYAPGETLVYTAALKVARAGRFDILRGFRTYPAAQRARLCDGSFAKNIVAPPEDQSPPFPPDAVGNNVEGRIDVPVPELRPGEYWLTSSAQKADGGEALTTVRFRVDRPCPGG
jgi:hypothetical protein